MNLAGAFMRPDQASSLLNQLRSGGGFVMPVKLISAGTTPEERAKSDAIAAKSKAAAECFVGLGNHPSVKLYGWRFCYDHGWMPV